MLIGKVYKIIAEFLKTQEQELKHNNLVAVYENFTKVYSRLDVNKLTEFLLSYGINPLDYLTEIPWYYADNVNKFYQGSFKIPNTITFIGRFAFSYTGITDLYISPSVKEIEGYAFDDCPLLEKVYIDGCPVIGLNAFDEREKEIIINCSPEDFEKVNDIAPDGVGYSDIFTGVGTSRSKVTLKFLK